MRIKEYTRVVLSASAVFFVMGLVMFSAALVLGQLDNPFGTVAPASVSYNRAIPDTFTWHKRTWVVQQVQGIIIDLDEDGKAEQDEAITYCPDDAGQEALVRVDVDLMLGRVQTNMLHEIFHVLTKCEDIKVSQHSFITNVSPDVVEFFKENPKLEKFVFHEK